MDRKTKDTIQELEKRVETLSEQIVEKNQQLVQAQASATPEASELQQVVERQRATLQKISEGRGKYAKLAGEALED